MRHRRQNEVSNSANAPRIYFFKRREKSIKRNSLDWREGHMKKIVCLFVSGPKVKGQKHIFPTIVEDQYSIMELEFIKTSERFSRVGNPNP